MGHFSELDVLCRTRYNNTARLQVLYPNIQVTILAINDSDIIIINCSFVL